MAGRTVAGRTVGQELLAVPGVSNIDVHGTDAKQLQVQFDPERLIQHNVSMDQVLAAARQATGIRGAGFISTGNQQIVLQSQGQSTTPEQLARTVLVHQNSATLTLGEVAHVAEAPAPAIGAATVMGQPAIILMVSA